MNLYLQRSPSAEGATIGTLSVEWVYECDTLEDVIREIPGESVAKWKIPGKTAIPAGKFRVALVNSPRFGPDTMSLIDVPGFTLVRIHAGNTASDTDGCILVGRASGNTLVGSGPALVKLKAKVQAAILTRREEVWLTVKNPKDSR